MIHSSVRRIIKKKEFKKLERFKTPQISEGRKKRKTGKASVLAKGLVKNSKSIEKFVLQDEKDFTLKVPLLP